MAKDHSDFLGRLTTPETVELIRQAFDVLPADDQLTTTIAIMNDDPDFLRDEILLHFEATARGLYD